MVWFGVHRQELDGLLYASEVHAGADAKIRTMVVGRNPSELNSLQSALSEIGTLELVAAADSIPSALDILEKSRPELIVIDQRVPVELVLKILESEGEKGRVAFGSVLEGIGLRAFGVVWDDSNHDVMSHSSTEIESAVRGGKQNGRGQSQARKLSADDPIILKLNDKYHVVRVRSILTISSARHYTYVVTQEGFKGIASKSMKDWEDRLPANGFVRAHRNTIINLECVERIERSRHSTYNIYLKAVDKPVPMSHRCFARIKRQFN
jgi:two-component system LytT family response regulator